MKFTKILTGSAMALMLATTSCRDDTFSEYWDNSDEYTVTFNIALEDMCPKTRDGEDVDTRTIGGGSAIDMLVYAVYYDSNKDKGQTGEKPDWQAATEYEKGDEDGFPGIEAKHGQTIINVEDKLQNGGFYPLTLTLKKGQDYQVVFWAQNHETEAFVIDDLKKVQMKYKILEDAEREVEEEGENGETVKKTEEYDKPHSINNDEKRDAFCRSINLSGNEANQNLTIYLKRPLAQINVGTRGFDFETITRNAQKKYLYSKIRINRAARFYNAVEDYTYTTTTQNATYDDPNPTTTEAFYTIDYEYNVLPAYWKWDRKEEDYPEFPSYTKYDKEDFKEIFPQKNIDKTGFTDADKFYDYYKDEEFLKVHLYEGPDGSGHVEADKGKYTPQDEEGYYTYASLGVGSDQNDKLSEVFKYLSMCYVLTATDDTKGEDLYNVKVWLATDQYGSDEVEIVNVNNVPVQRNRRTNIVGSLLTAEAKMDIVVDDDFAGRKIKGDGVQSGEIVEGFYYNADSNEFEISSVNGLLFFQQLVNGDLTVRQVNQNPYKTEHQGKENYAYPYYYKGGNYHLKYTSHKRKSDGGYLSDEQANLIVLGSKYDKLATNNFKDKASDKEWTFKVDSKSKDDVSKMWPVNNNFPFYGVTVKLMADIDLSGIDWIPIGFDCANWDGTLGNHNNSNGGSYGGYYTKDGKSLNYISLETSSSSRKYEFDLGRRRAFCGIFDGNGHTIYNMTTKKFSAKVHDEAIQDYGKNASNKYGPFDNVQWFARGFFGVVGPNAEIKNLRLQNVDVEGNNAVGALVGQVSSVGFPVRIQNCIVDGGRIDAVPLYRGDYQEDKNSYGRTIARGCYIGGVIGQFVAKDDTGNYTDDDNKKGYYNKGISEITNCEVRNLTIQGYRRMGGIAGAIADQGSTAMADQYVQVAIKVEKNSVVNSTIIVNQYRPFNFFWDFIGKDPNIWMNGFGWGTGSGYVPMTDTFVGGYYSKEEETTLSVNEKTGVKDEADAFSDTYANYIKKFKDDNEEHSFSTKESYYNNYVNVNNNVSNLQYTEIKTTPNLSNGTGNDTNNSTRTATARKSIIDNVPLRYLPMFTSLYADSVILNHNYYGETEIKTKIDFNPSDIWVGSNSATSCNFYLPLNFPDSWDIEYKEGATTYAGLYAESITLDSGHTSGRSVITPTGVQDEGSCVLYITARNRYQFVTDGKPRLSNYLIANPGEIGDKYRQPTHINNVVLRGSPYAWAGIIIAPNMNMSEVNLNNVSIYDVYQTIALQETASSASISDVNNKYQNYTVWPDPEDGVPDPYFKEKKGTSDPLNGEINLNVTNCNLRGYTKPGEGWSEITYRKTTFEQGSETRYSNSKSGIEKSDEFKTCKVQSLTTFDNCYFKAPYNIDLAEMSEKYNYADVHFTNCYATSTYDNVRIDLDAATTKAGKPIKYIGISSDSKAGKTVVRYYTKKAADSYVEL